MPTTPCDSASAGDSFALPPRISVAPQSAATRELRASPSSSSDGASPRSDSDAKHGAPRRCASAGSGERRRRSVGEPGRLLLAASGLTRRRCSPQGCPSAPRRACGRRRSTRCFCTAWSSATAAGGPSWLRRSCMAAVLRRRRVAAPCDQRPPRSCAFCARPVVEIRRSAFGRACELLCRGGPCSRGLRPCHGSDAPRFAGGLARAEVFPEAGGVARQESARGGRPRAGALRVGPRSAFCTRARRQRRR